MNVQRPFFKNALRKEITMLLIISTFKKRAEAVSDMFYYMGVLSYAATPTEALGEISDTYRAILILDPSNLPDTEDYLNKIRLYASSVPIFAIQSGDAGRNFDGLFDGSFPDECYSSSLVEEIVRYQFNHKLPLLAHYRLAGIDASCDIRKVKVFDESLDFTKTETMILRYLIVSYPVAQSTKNIVKYAFKPSRKPEITSIRTHISVMNKKFKDKTGRSLFISLPTLGYTVSTPEIIKEYSEII